MIFELSDNFIRSVSEEDLSDLVVRIMWGNHFLIVGGSSESRLLDAVLKHAGTNDRALFEKYILYGINPTLEIQTYLTTVTDTNYSYAQLKELAIRPAILLMENLREWGAYLRMIDVYRSNPQFSNLYKLLWEVVNNVDLFMPLQAGGCGELVHMIKSLSHRGYSRIAKTKICIVFDRDTTSYSKFKFSYNPLFYKLCGKKPPVLTNGDIYTLRQAKYIWHMWYRREIENYFPDSAFIALGKVRKAGKGLFENNPYAHVKDYYPYKKNDLKRLPMNMTRNLFEQGLTHFSEGGITMSELELFLLKIVKII